jgi:manganese/zinc/iron transport system permease protein
MSLWELFIEPWTIGDWMWRGMLTAALVAVPCAILGCFLYLRNMSLLSDALAHVALPGVVGAYLLTGRSDTLAVLIGATFAALVTTVLVQFIQRRSRTKSDAAIGIVFTALFALGIIMLSAFAGDAHLDLNCVLFGDVLGVADHSIWLLGIVTVLVITLVALFYRPLQLTAFDASMAAAVGIPVALIHGGLMAAISVTTVASLEAVGAVLVIAMIVTPAATAHLVTQRLHTMLGVAVAHALISGAMGMYLSIWINCSTAGAMVCTGMALYALAFARVRYLHWRNKLRIRRSLQGAT